MDATIALGADHAGFHYKQAIRRWLEEQGYAVLDFGTDSPASADYPDFVHPAAQAVEEGRARFGIVVCGSGNGVAMTANKHAGIRCALCWMDTLAALARQHNDANMLAIPARIVALELALSMVEVFLKTPFEGGRHARRVNKIACT
ncbi:MAG: ribose 5-phosphate isomerase B [Bacteroidetes bacterium]|nr:MAG: ribose 5-phosphate isomerase B [Bacteroidota bacterium]